MAVCAAANINTHNPKCTASVIIFPRDISGLLLSLVCLCKHFGMFLRSCVLCQRKKKSPCEFEKCVIFVGHLSPRFKPRFKPVYITVDGPH